MVRNLFGIQSVNLSGSSNIPKRKPINHGTRTNLLADSGAKCKNCGNSLRGLKPHIHHKDGNPRNNKATNLILVCPNCHSKLHRQMKSIKRKPAQNNSPFGISYKPIKYKPPKFDFF